MAEQTRKWIVVKGTDPVVVFEDNGDGTYTKWGYTVWGSVGSTGTLCEGVEVREAKTKAEKSAVEHHEALMARADRSQHALVTAMRAARDR